MQQETRQTNALLRKVAVIEGLLTPDYPIIVRLRYATHDGARSSTYHGGLSIQKVLPFGTPDDVRQATRKLIEAGRPGGFILSPSHSVPPDVPPENLVAMMEELRAQNEHARACT